MQFVDRNQVEAEIVGFDPFADVALLKVDPDGLDLDPLPLGSEDDVEVGEGVAAIGSPFGEEQSLSVGIVSASDRAIESLTDFRIEGAIQTDASINPGNSGGPLIDAERRGRRDQPADPDLLRGQRGGRLRGPDRSRPALDRGAA